MSILFILTKRYRAMGYTSNGCHLFSNPCECCLYWRALLSVMTMNELYCTPWAPFQPNDILGTALMSVWPAFSSFRLYLTVRLHCNRYKITLPRNVLLLELTANIHMYLQFSLWSINSPYGGRAYVSFKATCFLHSLFSTCSVRACNIAFRSWLN